MPLDYRDTTLSPDQRAQALLAQMTPAEKIVQLQSLLFMDWQDYADRDAAAGHVRNVACFLPPARRGAAEAAQAINEDTRRSVEANRFGLPVLQNGEALHGAQWGRATVFPQAIGLAASFDPALVHAIAQAVALELRAVGVRLVFAPVVNVVRDCRWGRTEETYGESVLLNAQLGAAYVRGLEENGVIAAPKHFVDNYADGGRDSNASLTSWRELREIFLEPFRACVEAGARSIMLAYNSVDGVPCSCSRTLIEEVLRKEWGFRGFTISDYGGVEGVCRNHRVASDDLHAQAMCLNSGLDVQLPNGYDRLPQALEQGLISEKTLDTAARRVLQAKIELGLLENPYVDPDAAERVVLCPAHIALAEKAAEKSLVLLKNEKGFLPLNRREITRIGVFGPAADKVATGGYTSSGAPDMATPLDALQNYLSGDVEVIHCPGDTGITDTAKGCDVLLYYAGILEGEGTDRSDIRLPDIQIAHHRDSDGGIIVSSQDNRVEVNQHKILRQLQESGRPLVVILLAGSPVDTEEWGDYASAILLAWYPGQRGGEAVTRALFGEFSPGGKLPISFPRSVGQLPLHYDAKPSGRGYGYIENDGSPRYPFGFGLSYTTFSLTDFSVETGARIILRLNVRNTGKRAGDEVVQVYAHGYNGSVVRPLKELKDFARVTLEPGEGKDVALTLDRRAFCCCGAQGNWGLFDGWCDLLLGTSSEDIVFTCTLSPEQLRALS